MNTLEGIEQRARFGVRQRAALDPNIAWVRSASVAFLVMPDAILEFLFIPVFGQLLVLLALTLSVTYLWVRRSLLLAVVVGVTVSVSIVSFVALSSAFGERVQSGFGFLLLGCTGVMILFCVVVTGALIALYERNDT